MAVKHSQITKRQQIRAVEAKRDALIIKHATVKTDLQKVRLELKQIRAKR